MSKGKLIVVDGLDGSGKSTQAPLVYQALIDRGIAAKLITFPDYNDTSSALVKLYLNGELSQSADGVNAYAASSFYAVDRYASFKRFWEREYLDGSVIVATRYVTSNAIHQMAKLPKSQWDQYLSWLQDYEYNKLGLPRPDKVLFLKMSRAVSQALLSKRYQGDESKKDIHEKDLAYLELCMQTAMYAAEKMGWEIIECSDETSPFSIETIAQTIQDMVDTIL